MYSWGIAFLLLLAITIFSLYEKKDKNGRKYVFPPGPKGLPFFGNVFQIPSFGASVVMKPWAEQFGEMYAIIWATADNRFRIRLFSTDVVYLNSSRVVSEILEKRSGITASRPPYPMVLDIVSGGKRMVMMPYNSTWRNIRKVMHQVLDLPDYLTKGPYVARGRKISTVDGTGKCSATLGILYESKRVVFTQWKICK